VQDRGKSEREREREKRARIEGEKAGAIGWRGWCDVHTISNQKRRRRGRYRGVVARAVRRRIGDRGGGGSGGREHRRVVLPGRQRVSVGPRGPAAEGPDEPSVGVAGGAAAGPRAPGRQLEEALEESGLTEPLLLLVELKVAAYVAVPAASGVVPPEGRRAPQGPRARRPRARALT
jgi:hypothetical protein